MTEIRLEICGVPVRFASAAPPLVAVFAEYFHYYSPQQSGLTALKAHDAELQVVLQLCDELPAPESFAPAGAELLGEAGLIRMWRAAVGGSEQFYFHAGASAYRTAPGRGLLEGFVTPAALDSPHALANTYTLLPLLLLLRSRARYYLHTAVIISPRERLYLICGAPRAGKSTLATALGVAGWRPIADDGLLLFEASGETRMQAFKRDFHLSVELLRRWPGLSGVTTRHFYADRTTVGGLEFFGTRELADVPRSRANTVIFPQITGEAESRLELIAAGEAVLKLTEQCIFFPLWREHTARQISLLARLVSGAACYRLLSGMDVWSDPLAASRLLEKV